ncbi:MAG: hypothetical protein AAF763_15395, partial [Pseudomonadota bacterium]
MTLIANGGPFFVNAEREASQRFADVTATDGGGFAVVWESNADFDADDEVILRLFDEDGEPTTGDLGLTDLRERDQEDSRIAQLAGGDLVVVWESSFEDGSFAGVFARLTAPDGTPRGPAFRVNETVEDDQAEPAVAALSEGGFVVVWQSRGIDGSADAVMSRRYAADGTPEGGEVKVNQSVEGAQRLAEVAALPDDGFVVTFANGDPALARDPFFFGRASFRIDGFDEAELIEDFEPWEVTRAPSIAPLAGGGFAAAFGYRGNPNDDNILEAGEPTGLLVRVIGPTGGASGAFEIDTTGGAIDHHDVAALPDGGFVLAYARNGEALNEADVFLQRFD